MYMEILYVNNKLIGNEVFLVISAAAIPGPPGPQGPPGPPGPATGGSGPVSATLIISQ